MAGAQTPATNFAGPNHQFYAAAGALSTECGCSDADPPTPFDKHGLHESVESARSWSGELVQRRWVHFKGTIDEFHGAFGGKDDFCYQQLERRHDYIQWLFPSPERSAFNQGSVPL
eukprot:SAG22_NODE_3888_length_1482_cov_1.383225_1_plen_115_part_10